MARFYSLNVEALGHGGGRGVVGGGGWEVLEVPKGPVASKRELEGTSQKKWIRRRGMQCPACRESPGRNVAALRHRGCTPKNPFWALFCICAPFRRCLRGSAWRGVSRPRPLSILVICSGSDVHMLPGVSGPPGRWKACSVGFSCRAFNFKLASLWGVVCVYLQQELA